MDGRYRIVRQLGRGGSKEVYLAHDNRLDRDVALAIVPGASVEDSARVRLDREARVMARLGEHPNIVTVYDFAEDQGVPYFAARLMAGGSLADRLAAAPGSRLDVRRNELAVAHANAFVTFYFEGLSASP